MIILRIQFILILVAIASAPTHAQTIFAPGEQPQITLDSKDLIRIVYGDKGKIFYATSNDKGETFSKPVLAAEVTDMHLGMTRGPQLASSKDYSMMTAMDKKGNIHSFRLTHKTGKWEKLSQVNDIDGSAPEGLMSISADDNNNFYAVWLDLREERKNNICFSYFRDGKWSKNKFAYKSPESHVCECCKPSIAVKGNTVAIMFRNWLKGSRDLYLITSSNNGQSFSEAQKLGNGTWPLKGCPMDGGGLAIDSENQIHTAWQRDGIVYYAEPGKPEERFGEGRGVSVNGSVVNWQRGSALIVKKPGGTEKEIGEGTALTTYEFADGRMLAVWEKDDQIVFKKF